MPLPPFLWVLTIEIFLLICIVAGRAIFRPVTLSHAARILDRLAGTHNRARTALDFSQHPDHPLRALAIEECTTWLSAHPLPEIPRIAPRLRALWLIPFVSLCAIYFTPGAAGGLSQPKTPVDPVAEMLEQIQQEMEEAIDQKDETRMQELAEQLKQLAVAPKIEADAAERLREIAKLEAMLRNLRDQVERNEFSKESLEALARALEPTDPKTAEALRSGDSQQAGRELERMLREMAERGNAERALRELAEAMGQQAAGMSEEEKSALTEQMEQAAALAASDEMRELQEKMQEIAEMLRQRGGPPPNSSGGQQGESQSSQGGQQPPMTKEMLQQMLEALEQMKQQLQQQGEQGEGEGKNGEGQQQPAGLGQGEMPFPFPIPGGVDRGQPPGPGSELDKGTTESETGDEPPVETKPEGPARLITGAPTGGESSTEFIEASGDNSRADRDYKAVYEALEADRRDAMQREEIPPGSRVFLRRYFEAIRPNY